VQSAAEQQQRILLVEDNAINQLVTASMLESEGFVVVVAGDGVEALTRLRHESFDAILMDVQMPLMDGLAATRAIRQQERETGKHVPIIALTANVFAADRAACMAAGMDDFLAKPISFADLDRVLAPLLLAPGA
jgi:CheY-like chemotaxis protein